MVTPEMIEAGRRAWQSAIKDRNLDQWLEHIYLAMKALDPEVEQLAREAIRQQARADQQAEWAIREAERCVSLETLFAETAILLTHPDEARRAEAKERVFTILFASQTQSQAQDDER